jgi:hypothetical protein
MVESVFLDTGGMGADFGGSALMVRSLQIREVPLRKLKVALAKSDSLNEVELERITVMEFIVKVAECSVRKVRTGW